MHAIDSSGAILLVVVSYVAVAGAEQGIGHDKVLAVVGDDGSEMRVIGRGNVADDLTDRITGDIPWLDPHERLIWATEGMTYFTISGPHDFEGTIRDLPAVAAIYGLTP